MTFFNTSLARTDEPWPLLGGADIELCNILTGHDATHSDAAAKAILAEIGGISADRFAGSASSASSSAGGSASDGQSRFNPQDWARKYLPTNGGCIYIDLGHVELAFPEITSAMDFVTYWPAMLRYVIRAREDANRHLPPGQRIEVMANNSGNNVSWGSHLNFAVPRRAYDRILYQTIDLLPLLASYQVSSILFTGQGKVGSENGRPPVDYQITQRAGDFSETISGVQTTYRRPLVNLRDEPLCGRSYGQKERHPSKKWARLHVIFYDSTLCDVASYLKFGLMQIVLRMLGQGQISSRLILENPLLAVAAWSHDITLQRTMPLLMGGSVTAIEHQMMFLEEAQRFVAGGKCNVPDAPQLLALWEDTLAKLKARAWESLAPRLDWVCKLQIIQNSMRRHPNLTWQSPQVKYLDHLWSSLDVRSGLFWTMQRAGGIERLVSDEQIARAMDEPPEKTRAWARAALLRKAAATDINAMDWDEITFNVRTRSGLAATRTLQLPDPFFTRAQFEALTSRDADLSELLDQMGADAPILQPIVSSQADSAYSSPYGYPEQERFS